MTTSVTFRMPAKKRTMLRRKAKLLGMTESEYLRKLLDRELGVRPSAEALRIRREKLKALAGSVTLTGKLDSWDKELYKNNWRT